MRVGSGRVRIAAIALVGAASLALAGCSSSDSGGGSDSDGAASTVDLGTPNKATGSPIKIGSLGQESDLNKDQRILGVRATAAYMNEYLGGINGHVIELDECSTGDTPAGGTACGVQFAKNGDAAVIAANASQAGSVYAAQGDTPFVTSITAEVDILGSDHAFIMSNPLGLGSASIAIAQDEGATTGAIVMPDLPTTTGPVKDLSQPLYDAAGIELLIVPISLQTADPTAQIQQALNDGADLFTLFGDSTFVTTALRSLRQAGYEGKVITQLSSFPEDQVANIPGGLKDVVTLTSVDKNPDNPENELYHAVIEKFGDGADAESDFVSDAYQTLLALGAGVGLTEDATADAAGVNEAMLSMSRPVVLPLSGGMTFQCGAGKTFLPAPCVGTVLKSVLDEKGVPVEQEVLSSADAS